MKRGRLPRVIATRTWADGNGHWHSMVLMDRNVRRSWLSENVESLRSAARQAVVTELALRDGKTWETYLEAAERVDSTLGRVAYVGSRFTELGYARGFEFRELEDGESLPVGELELTEADRADA